MEKGNTVYSFTYDAFGRPVAITEGNTRYFYILNQQGDVVGIVNGNGSFVVQYFYDAWGRLLSTAGALSSTLGVNNPLRYRGYVYDTETGFYYLQSRYYNPEMGRFINADNQLSFSDSTGLNLFAYCNNNPPKHRDPSGHALETIFDVLSVGFGISDVWNNISDVWAWVVLGADLVDLIPFVSCLGEKVRAYRAVDKAADVVQGAKRVDDVPESFTTIYRSVSKAEADDILTTGRFNLSPTGMEAKQFAFSYSETARFGQKMGQNIIVSAKLPTSKLSIFYSGGIGGIDTSIFRSGTLTVYADQLDAFNDAVKGTIRFVP